MLTHICASCNIELPDNLFSYEKRGYRRKNCNSCRYNKKAFDGFKLLKEKPDYLICRICNIEKEYNDINFYKDDNCKFKLRRECKACTKSKNIAFHYRKQYNMTMEQVNILKQECEICGSSTALCIDHCHTTGKVRGSLCQKCNTGIGMLQDDVEIVKKAYIYLDKWDC